MRLAVGDGVEVESTPDAPVTRIASLVPEFTKVILCDGQLDTDPQLHWRTRRAAEGCFPVLPVANARTRTWSPSLTTPRVVPPGLGKWLAGRQRLPTTVCTFVRLQLASGVWTWFTGAAPPKAMTC